MYKLVDCNSMVQIQCTEAVWISQGGIGHFKSLAFYGQRKILHFLRYTALENVSMVK